MWPHESINTKATSLWILAARNTRILNLILAAISLGYKCSLKHSQKITVVNTNCDNNWCKMGLLFVLHWKQSGFHPAVCGFFWDLCSSFCIYYKFIPIKAFFFETESTRRDVGRPGLLHLHVTRNINQASLLFIGQFALLIHWHGILSKKRVSARETTNSVTGCMVHFAC